MKKIIVPFLAAVGAVVGIAVCSTQSVGGPVTGGPVSGAALPPGKQFYQPTRLEWAVVALNALWGERDMSGVNRPIHYLFREGRDGVHIVCTLTYDDETPSSQIDQAKRLTEIQVDDFAKTHNWPWLKLQFDTVAIPTLHSKGAATGN